MITEIVDLYVITHNVAKKIKKLEPNTGQITLESGGKLTVKEVYYMGWAIGTKFQCQES